MNKKIIPYICIALFALISCVCLEIFYPQKKERVWQHEVSSTNHCDALDNDFCTHLPLIKIDTYKENILEQKEILSTISIIDNIDGNNHYHDKPKLTTNSLIKIRGASSSEFDKKQYRLTFVESEGNNEIIYNDDELQELSHVSYKVMGMPKESEWVLNGPYLDKSLIRNYLMYNLSGEIMEWAPNVRFCELFINDEYKGLYIMVESIKADKRRVDIKMNNVKNPITEYLIDRDRIGHSKSPLNNYGTYSWLTKNELGIVYPGTKSSSTDLQKEYIRLDISAFEKMLYSIDYDDQLIGYKSKINVESFVDYYIINEFSINIDSGNLSTYSYKDSRAGLMMGPVWDFNSAFNNYKFLYDIKDFYIYNRPWYYMLFKDEEFVEQVINRYHFLRNGVLSEERLLKLIDDTVEYLGPAIDRNNELWNSSFELNILENKDNKGNILDYERNIKNYDEAIKQLKECIIERGRFLDEYIHVLRQFCAESQVKNWN